MLVSFRQKTMANFLRELPLYTILSLSYRRTLK